MKRLLNTLFMVIFCLLTTACNNSGYTEITYKKLLTKINNQDNFILMIGSKTCLHCDQFKDTIKDINKKYSINIMYIDISKLSESEVSDLKGFFPFEGTPTTINVVGGAEENSLSRITGSKDYSYTKEKLINWGYIKE